MNPDPELREYVVTAFTSVQKEWQKVVEARNEEEAIDKCSTDDPEFDGGWVEVDRWFGDIMIDDAYELEHEEPGEEAA